MSKDLEKAKAFAVVTFIIDGVVIKTKAQVVGYDESTGYDSKHLSLKEIDDFFNKDKTVSAELKDMSINGYNCPEIEIGITEEGMIAGIVYDTEHYELEGGEVEVTKKRINNSRLIDIRIFTDNDTQYIEWVWKSGLFFKVGEYGITDAFYAKLFL